MSRVRASASVARVPLVTALLLATACSGGSPGARPAESGDASGLLRWSGFAIDTSGIDHTPVGPGENRTAKEQYGPCRASRAMAIVHIALFDAAVSVAGGYQPYEPVPRAAAGASLEAAVAQAAHDTLTALYPSQAPRLDDELRKALDELPGGRARDHGAAAGALAAAAILSDRAGDGSAHSEPTIGRDYVVSREPGHWRPDPVHANELALGARWREVRPFVLASASALRVAPPPALTSDAYAAAFAEVARMGGDGAVTASARTAEQTEIGLFWAYDGTPSLCAPTRLYNQIAAQLVRERGIDAIATARILALANVAMADAAIAGWESKYFHDFWRPVTGIREAEPGTGPTGRGDGNPRTVGDPRFTPLGAPASNEATSGFTPPFPAYPSGHAVFGGALFETLREALGTDHVPFVFVSDELDGVTVGADGEPRPLAPRSFETLSRAEEENGQSRIYLGIHWAFDKAAGIEQGRAVAREVTAKLFAPAP
ncbi:MAG: vanadium-dependent haloperoxidase [Deltaproteobacteria bacterium]|nr:vanadium-dependent haloperoxidase [Deltaproteobacteria bacterium]